MCDTTPNFLCEWRASKLRPLCLHCKPLAHKAISPALTRCSHKTSYESFSTKAKSHMEITWVLHRQKEEGSFPRADLLCNPPVPRFTMPFKFFANSFILYCYIQFSWWWLSHLGEFPITKPQFHSLWTFMQKASPCRVGSCLRVCLKTQHSRTQRKYAWINAWKKANQWMGWGTSPLKCRPLPRMICNDQGHAERNS